LIHLFLALQVSALAEGRTESPDRAVYTPAPHDRRRVCLFSFLYFDNFVLGQAQGYFTQCSWQIKIMWETVTLAIAGKEVTVRPSTMSRPRWSGAEDNRNLLSQYLTELRKFIYKYPQRNIQILSFSELGVKVAVYNVSVVAHKKVDLLKYPR